MMNLQNESQIDVDVQVDLPTIPSAGNDNLRSTEHLSYITISLKYNLLRRGGESVTLALDRWWEVTLRWDQTSGQNVLLDEL